MESDAFRRATAIFREIYELASDEQEREVERRCGGDADLRKLVLELLASDRDAERRVVRAELKSKSSLGEDDVPARVSTPTVDGFRVHSRIGEGGAGVVWRATQENTRREVALKLYARGATGSKRSAARFEREVELAAMLTHPGIARLYDSGITGDTPYYVMELVEGKELDAYLADTKLDDRSILELFESLCRAVEHAHIRGVIHRDLKPSNVIVRANGQPVVVDFGLAKAFEKDDSGQTVSLDGQIVGTPAYMSPEQASGQVRTLDTRTDVYSLGVLLFRALSGSLPHATGGSTLDTLRRVAESDALSLAKARPKVDPDLVTLVGKALERDPDDRYSTAGALAAEIRRWLNGEPLEARAHSTLYALRKGVRRHRSPIAVSLALLLCAVIGVLAYIGSLRASREETERWVYAHRIQLAGQAYSERKLQEARDLLARSPAYLRNWEWDYLSRLLTPSVPFGPGVRVLGLDFSSDGALSVVGTGKRFGDVDWGEAVLLRGGGREIIRRIPQPNSVDDVAFTVDDEELWVGIRKSNVRRYRVEDGKFLSEEPFHFARKIKFSPDGHWVAVVANESGLVIQNLPERERRHVLGPQGPSDPAVSFSADSTRLLWSCAEVSAGKSYALLVDVASGREVARWEDASRFRWSVLSPDGKLALISERGNLHLWNLEGEANVRSTYEAVSAHTFYAATPGADGSRLITATREALDVWDLHKLSAEQSLASPVGYRLEKLWTMLHEDHPFGLVHHPRRAEAYVFGKISARYDVGQDPSSRLLARHPIVEVGEIAPDIVAGPQSKRCAFFGSRGLEVRTIADGTLLWSHQRASTRARAVDWSSDDSVVVSGWGTVYTSRVRPAGALVVHDSSSGAVLRECAVERRVIALTIAPSRGYVAVFSGPTGSLGVESGSTMVSTHSLSDLSTLWQEEIQGKAIRGPSIGFSLDESFFVFEGEWMLRAWETGTWKELHSIELDDVLSLNSFAFHPREPRLAAVIEGELVEMDTRSWEVTRVLGRLGEKPPGLAYSPDGARLAVPGRDGVRLRDVATGAALVTLGAGSTEKAVFTPDGEWVLTASNDESGFRAWPRHGGKDRPGER